MSEIDVKQGREALPIEALLLMLRKDFPELVDHARKVLGDPNRSRAQAEETVRAMIAAKATWENSRRSRWAA